MHIHTYLYLLLFNCIYIYIHRYEREREGEGLRLCCHHKVGEAMKQVAEESNILNLQTFVWVRVNVWTDVRVLRDTRYCVSFADQAAKKLMIRREREKTHGRNN